MKDPQCPDRVHQGRTIKEDEMNEATIDTLHENKLLSELDYRFARFLGRLDGTLDTKLLLAAALVSRERGEGHICIDLTAYAGTAIDMPGIGAPGLPSPERMAECSPCKPRGGETW